MDDIRIDLDQSKEQCEKLYNEFKKDWKANYNSEEKAIQAITDSLPDKAKVLLKHAMQYSVLQKRKNESCYVFQFHEDSICEQLKLSINDIIFATDLLFRIRISFEKEKNMIFKSYPLIETIHHKDDSYTIVFNSYVNSYIEKLKDNR